MSTLIAFEGIDGIGKTTHMQALSEFLNTMQVRHITTRELLGDDIRGTLRNLLMHRWDGREELMIISLARRWHWQNIVQPALDRGSIVLIDRFIESTWAYQAGGRKLPASMLDFFEQEIWEVRAPDMTIYLHGTSHRDDKNDRFERESPDFFNRVIDMYESRKNDTWRTFDSNQPVNDVQKCIQDEVMRFVGR